MNKQLFLPQLLCLGFILFLLPLAGCTQQPQKGMQNKAEGNTAEADSSYTCANPEDANYSMNKKFTPEEEAALKKRLGELAFRVTQQEATEPAFSGKLYYNKADGVYRCIVCQTPLFTSETKYESGSGWPSFFQPINDSVVGVKTDRSHGMVREEVHCNNCGAHLGHVFPDGPQPTGLRYCINSVSLDFEDLPEEQLDSLKVDFDEVSGSQGEQ